jgi:hypothetical protein
MWELSEVINIAESRGYELQLKNRSNTLLFFKKDNIILSLFVENEEFTLRYHIKDEVEIQTPEYKKFTDDVFFNEVEYKFEDLVDSYEVGYKEKCKRISLDAIAYILNEVGIGYNGQHITFNILELEELSGIDCYGVKTDSVKERGICFELGNEGHTLEIKESNEKIRILLSTKLIDREELLKLGFVVDYLYNGLKEVAVEADDLHTLRIAYYDDSKVASKIKEALERYGGRK